MKITDITYVPVVVGYKPEYQHDLRFYPKPPAQSNVVVTIHTDEGVFGIGEAPNTPGLYGENENHTIAGIEYFKPYLIGRDPVELTALNAEMDRLSPIGNHAAKVGIDMALHDLAGKALGVPVYQLLGGRVHDKVVTHISPATYEETSAQVSKLMAQGYRIFKQKMSGNTEYDLRLVHALLDQVPLDVTISLDVNQGWSTTQTLRILGELERRPQFPTNIIIEQPTHAADFAGQAYIRRHTQIPLLLDDGIRTADDLRKIFDLGAADIVSLKMSRVGGIQKCRQMIHMAEAANVSYIVDEINDMRIANTAVAHLAVASRRPLYTGVTCHTLLEFDIVGRGGVQLVDGCAIVPDGPGLGIEEVRYPDAVPAGGSR
ncbi:mandelate racemase/muconate lactonizing enzyme family protein [Luedemannella helvata]|uniref:Dipeptide epimerase n=1 Tax=Luedemannella helvata TaxID=349315 RepID=A0ABN2JYG0_9ACTN